MKQITKEAFNKEMSLAKNFFLQRKFEESFFHLERAHILGQYNVKAHTLSHIYMLKIAWKRRAIKEFLGQLIRIPLGIIGSSVGIVPTGNTGGSNVSAFKKMEIPEDLKIFLD